MERFLLLFKKQNDKDVRRTAFEITLRSLSKITFLDFQPSQLAASAVMLSINLNDEEELRDIENCKDIWSPEIEEITSYTL